MSPPDEPPFPALPPADVHAALRERREIALLDVREEDPFAQEHPLWAANLPLARIELDAWGRIPRRDTRIVVYGTPATEARQPTLAPDAARGRAATDDASDAAAAADQAHGSDARDGAHDASAEALARASTGADEALLAARRLRALGYTQVHLLQGGLAAWRAAGLELFRDVNVPSKAFGEWVEAERHTPSLPAPEVQALLDAGADVVVLDARRFDEYQTMSIPGAISVPGAELVLRVRDLAPDPTTRVIVNCAGRTRSLIGAQSLVNAGVPNPVAALRNGTIGWTLAGQTLDHGASRRCPQASDAARAAARRDARAVAQRAGVARIDATQLARWQAETSRTTYAFDVRTPEEYAAGHPPGFRSAPGGQLVQETDVHAPVRGARLVLADHDGTPEGDRDAGVRAEMTASWLAQMGWEVAVLEAPPSTPTAPRSRETGADVPPRPAPPAVPRVSPATLADWLASPPRKPTQAAESLKDGEAATAGVPVLVVDVGTSARYRQRHVPGAWFVLRSQLAVALDALPRADRIVVTCGSGLLAPWAARDLREWLTAQGRAGEVLVLDGGTDAWVAAGLPVEAGNTHPASPPIDRYRRPYEGTDNPASAMQAYLDWEFGLVDQLKRDGTHHFAPI